LYLLQASVGMAASAFQDAAKQHPSSIGEQPTPPQPNFTKSSPSINETGTPGGDNPVAQFTTASGVMT
jgi:hypothetical protein